MSGGRAQTRLPHKSHNSGTKGRLLKDTHRQLSQMREAGALAVLAQLGRLTLVAGKQQTIISHSCGGCETRPRGQPAVWGSGGDPLPAAHLCPHAASGRGCSGGPSSKGADPFHRALPSRPRPLPKAPLPHGISLGVRFALLGVERRPLLVHSSYE